MIVPRIYKYVSADAAKCILKLASLRCSSPILFNDPFDGQIKGALKFSEQELDDYLVERVAEKLYDFSDKLSGQVSEKYNYILERLRVSKLEGRTEIGKR